MTLRTFIAGLLIAVSAFAAETGAELFQKARTQETAAGNLDEAITLYQRVATEFASDRALAAKALVAEAQCYEKLGNDRHDKAVKLYEQVARDYRDQREPVATANARLAALRQGERVATPATMTQRRIELPDLDTGPSDLDATDGQRLVFKDSDTGALTISDLTGSGRRVIYKPSPRAINSFLLSRDGSLVVMVLAKPGSTKTFAVVRTDGTGFREFGGDWVGIRPCDEEISWDNRSVLFCQRQADGPPQLLRFSMASGEISRIREADGGEYRFSPDGRFIAYNSAKKIFIIPSQGGEPQLAADNGTFFYDWTRDGLNLITDTTSGGARALNLLPVQDGRQLGKPVFVRYGNFARGRTTASGAFLYGATPGEGLTPWLGNLVSAGGSSGWEELSLTGSGAGTHYPTWSPDSTKIAYLTYNGAAGQYLADLRVRTLSSGEERDLYHSDLFTTCLWSGLHPSLVCIQRGARNNNALSISTETGYAETLGNVPADVDTAAVPVALADDDRAVYLASPKQGLIRWEIGAAQWTTVLPNPNAAQSTGYASVSPDGRWITRWGTGNIEIRPMSGGDWRPLIPAPDRMNAAFTSDGNWFVYRARDAAGRYGLFRIATAGGQPEQLGDFPGKNVAGGHIWISPDGKKVIAEGVSHEELWMLENFEPKQQAAK